MSGTEDFLADRAIRLLRDILRAEDPSLEVNDLDASGYAPGELITLASPSLFAEPRMIRATAVEKCSDDFLSETLRYLEAPADDTYLVLRHAGGMRGKKLLDAVRGGLGGGIEIICAELKKDTDKLDFAAAEFSAAGRRAQRRVRCAPSSRRSPATWPNWPARASNCSSDVGDDITERTVEKYYAGRVETSAFRVADVAIAGRHGEALDPAAARPGIRRRSGSAGRRLREQTAHDGQGVRRRAAVGRQLAQKFGLAPWQVDRARRDLQGWTDAGLGAAHPAARRDRRSGQGRGTGSGVRAGADDRHRQPARLQYAPSGDCARPSQRRPGERGSFVTYGRENWLERGDLLGDRRLAVRGLVLVQDALAGGLVQLLRRDGERGGGLRRRRRWRSPRGWHGSRS